MQPALPAELPAGAEPAQLTREVFGNVPAWAQTLFYLLAAAAVGVFVYGIVRRVRLWRKGRPACDAVSWRTAVRRLLRDVLLQKRLWGRGMASLAHVLLFSGFVVLLIGTTLIGVEHFLADVLGREPNAPVFHKGLYFGVYELVTDTFGVALIAGCGMFLVRRLRGTGSFARSPADVGVLVALLAIGVTGYAVESLRIIHAETRLAGLSPVGYLCAAAFQGTGIGREAAGQFHFLLWWTHAALALGFIALMPYTRLLHSLAGMVNLAIRDHALGVLQPVSIAEVETTGQIGVARLADFSYRQLIELDACVSCGRCEDSCPAFEAGKPLSPRNVVQDLVGAMNGPGLEQNVHGDVIAAETLWSCTTCGACADVCPLGISPMRMITDMRRYLIGEGALRGSPAVALQKTERAGNPWGMAASDRLAWAAGLDVPLASERPDFEWLYWVGCAAAYDRRAQKVARSVARLLKAANVNFAVLGTEERCTGESARRMGDEFLFQQLAEQNVATFASRGAKKILAHCPHCVNSLRNDYSQFGGQFEVVHHSQLLSELVQQGRLKPAAHGKSAAGSITYHDPCYLARVSGVTEPPRAVLAASASGTGQATVVELPRNRRQTACCGAGGGRMWFDDALAQRVGQTRVREIAASGSDTVAVACPFCLVMLTDGLAAHRPDVQVRDIAEVLAEAVFEREANS
ncbi:MAG: 4Fe-4S dicluster domain-containing protein [Planctomycetes bacterium]|nr:4Fe-4S dicluster domain-containing protein [Planctomycetota bacterium]